MKLLLLSIITAFGALFMNNSVPELNSDGKTVFENSCASCHTGGFKGWMSGAPEIGEKEEWTKFFEKGESSMNKNVFEGTKRHEAKGGCDDCSKEQIEAAIKFILSETK